MRQLPSGQHSDMTEDKRARTFRALELGVPLLLRTRQHPASTLDASQALPVVTREPDRATLLSGGPLDERLPMAGASLAEPSMAVAKGLDTLDLLRAEVSACQACALCESRSQTVFESGQARARLVIIGDAPDADEELAGASFAGKPGELLDNMLSSIGLHRESDVYLCNFLKCKLPQGRDPGPAEFQSCEGFLKRQIALVRPDVLLVMGRFAAQFMLASEAGVASLRGKMHEYRLGDVHIPLMVAYSPSYLMRNPVDKANAWVDLCLLKAALGRLQTQAGRD